MKAQLYRFSCLLVGIVILNLGPTCLAAQNENYTTCDKSYSCANLQNLRYPFWGGDRPEICGHPTFGLNCSGDAALITLKSGEYRVLSINYDSSNLVVVADEFWNNPCPKYPYNTSLDTDHFSYSSGYTPLELFHGCPANQSTTIGMTFPNWWTCYTNDTTTISYYLTTSANTAPSPVTCGTSVSVRVNGTAAEALAQRTPTMNISQAVNGGFGLDWKANDSSYCSPCVGSGGLCGSNSSSGGFACYCSDQAYPRICGSNSTTVQNGGGDSKNIDSEKIVLPIVGAIVAGVGLGWAIFSIKQRRKRKADMAAQSSIVAKSKDISSPPLTKSLTSASTNYSRSTPSYVSSRTEFGMASTYFGAQVFSYAELEEATNNFDPSMELGDGGFGTVYYGKLQDGRVVAVKRLYENNFKRVEQFMNEVQILTTLRHDNLVTLYGCTSKRSRELLLVYEYIPNGTVADHLHGKRSNSGLLSWPIRLNIAIETADALAYLHRSTIIHRDVKTNNILLDNDFRVKVADFGLSRLFPNDVTHVSTAPQGTPGYVDPEYYQCYQLTEKSDVYSFGVVLIELISSKMAVDTNRDRHDINLANMAINKIQNHALNELVDPSVGFETNPLVRRMTTLVAELAFRCLQTERDMRPSMDEVVKALRGIKEGDSLNGEKAEVVDIIVEDDSGPLKGHPPPMSPDSNVTDKNVSSSNGVNSFS